MAPPDEVVKWLGRTYPKPRVDPVRLQWCTGLRFLISRRTFLQEWLDACYGWVTENYSLDPSKDMDRIIQEVNNQLLESDLADSMVHGTGLPTNITVENEKMTLPEPPILVQIVSITDIGVSAAALEKTKRIREERVAAGEVEENEEVDEEIQGEGAIPKYQRSMLRLELSDGHTILRGMEYKRLPELVLGTTKLGYKVGVSLPLVKETEHDMNAQMLLRSPVIRRGIAFLSPECVELKGHSNEDLDKLQDRSFTRSLYHRMGYVRS
jgi:RecQ-mediated genome instability protein 1